MAQFQSIKFLRYDPIAKGRPSLEDQYRLKQRESPRSIEQRPLQSNPLGNALAGFRTSSPGRIRGGSFAPRATSGML